jgi:hypothetical protein
MPDDHKADRIVVLSLGLGDPVVKYTHVAALAREVQWWRSRRATP